MYTSELEKMSRCCWYRGRGSKALMPRVVEVKDDHPLAYYKNRTPEKMENLRTLIPRRPSMKTELESLRREDDGKLQYMEKWRHGPTVIYKDLEGNKIKFLRGGLSAKTRGGPEYMYYRRCWNYYTTRDWPLHYLHRIIFPGGRTRRRYVPDLTYRDEYMSSEGPKVPVHPGGSGKYWKPKKGDPNSNQGGWTPKPEPATRDPKLKSKKKLR